MVPQRQQELDLLGRERICRVPRRPCAVPVWGDQGPDADYPPAIREYNERRIQQGYC